jgi:Holliday junction resolvasome RuvABC endonuclease subunit
MHAIQVRDARIRREMQEMIKRLLDLDEIPKQDAAADGLSIAFCYIR